MSFIRNRSGQNVIASIIIAGLLAGILDMAAAFLNYMIATGKNPAGVLKYIASGVFGKAAFRGNETMAVWGFVFHMGIALSFAFLFFLLCLKLTWVYKNKWLAGVIYGIVVWAIMNLLVVPLSNAPHIPFNAAKSLLAVVILIVCIGLPVSFIVGNYFRKYKLQRL